MSSSNEPIAVIGSGCRFPGGVNSPSQLWDLLKDAPDVAKRIPIDRFNLDRYYHPDGSHHGTSNVQESYFLDQDVRCFDAGFFGIPPGEAAAMDPQHRILLETVYEAMEVAGLRIGDLQGSDTAAYVGIMRCDYYLLAAQDTNVNNTYQSTGIANSNASARLSYFFDWHGPCMTIDTACSSSLVAVHHAVQVLRQGTSRIAVAAGTNLLLSPHGYISESKLNMLSPTGRCHMWDSAADGYARGEGVAALILKRLSDAIADGDEIDCIIRETGCNQDGRTKGITMPSAKTQASLIRDTYRRAGLDPRKAQDRCQYFEAHGTGTPAGDPQEAEAIQTVFFPEELSSTNDVLYVGSIKTVLGHTEGTAGIAGLMKASLAMKHGMIPPNLHFHEFNLVVKPFCNNLDLVSSLRPWPEVPDGQPRRASVNSFGFGGINSHAIIESYIDYRHNARASEPLDSHTDSLLPLVFSATSEKSLRALVTSYRTHLDNVAKLELRALAYTLACCRTPHPYRITVPAGTFQETRMVINTLAPSDIHNFTGKCATNSPSILGIFTGQGAQWPQMGAALVRASTHVRKLVADLDHSLQTLPKADRPRWSILDELQASASESRVAEATISQPLTCAVQLVLIALLQTANVKFRAIIGHSSGEIAAAHAAGFLTSHDAIRIAYYRGFHSHLAGNESGKQGAMLAAGISLEEATSICALDKFKGRIVVAASNSATSITLSGDADAIAEVHDSLHAQERFVRLLRVDKAYHSHHMIRASGLFLQSLEACGIKLQKPLENAPRWFSSVEPGQITSATTDLASTYWTNNLINPVLFSQAVESAVTVHDSFDAALEVGPHPALKGPTSDVYEQMVGKPINSYFGCLSRGKNDVGAFSDTLGSLWSMGVKIDFDALHTTLYEDAKAIPVLRDLPIYPWDHDRVLWSESRSSILRRQQQGRFHDLLGQREPDGTEEGWRWRTLLSIQELPWLADHGLQGQVVFPATGYICLGVEAAMQVAGTRTVQLLEMTDVYVRKAISIDEKAGTEVLTTMNDIQEDGKYMTASFSCFSTASKDALGLALNATGTVRLTIGPALDGILASRSQLPYGMQPVNVDHFYSEVTNLGYNYGPTFRGITQLERRMGSSTGTIVGPGNKETCQILLFHPGMLDAALQGLLCAFSSPGDNRLWSLHAPSTIQKVTLVPSICGANMTSEVTFDCTARDIEKKDLYGDVEIYQSDSDLKSISVEGVGFVPFTAASASNDKALFAYEKYDVDRPDGTIALNNWRATPEQIRKGLDCERVAFYYLRTLREEVDEAERKAIGIDWHHEALFDYADHICGIVDRGEHAYIKKEWQSDTYDSIQSIMQRYSPSDPDFILTVATGENLAAAVRRQTTILEHMTKNDRLNKYYESALGFAELNRLMATVVHQIAYRYPGMNILEIGAGTGGASREIFAKLSTAYKSYTYTDISSGFFEKAKENFAVYGDRMIYNTLDVTKDPCEQGYVECAYDLVVAANVLHATPDLELTLRNARKMLRPGGYLVMMEFIDDSCSRLGVVIGGLPGWWVGRETGRRWSPNVSLGEWNELLLRSGFGGVDTSTPVLDPLVMPAAIIVAQAVDEDVRMLRDPLASPPGENCLSTKSELVLLGGKQPETQHVVDSMMPHLQERYSRVIHVKGWDDLIVDPTATDLTFVNLSDVDESFWDTITNDRFEKLKQILLESNTVLWATWGADRNNPDGAQTMGFFRSLRYELPTTQLQIVDFETPHKVNTDFLQTCILRLQVTAEWQRKGVSDSKLWTTEPEIRVRDGIVQIPRLLPQKEQNDRYNSGKRDIVKEVNLREATTALEWDSDDERYTLREEEETTRRPKVKGHRQVRVDASLLSSIPTPVGHLFFSLGTDVDTGERVLSVSSTNASYISVPHEWTVTLESETVVELQYLTFLSGYLLSRAVIALVPRGSSVVIHEADPGLASMIARQLSDHECQVLFTTAGDHFNRKNWVTIHPFAQMRHIQAALPKDASVYLDLSSLLSATSSDTLSARIAANLPRSCKKYDASIFVDRGADVLPNVEDRMFGNLLEAANDFVTGQANGVPDGMPLRIYPVREIVSKPKSIDSMSIVQWHGEPTAPVRVEPIHCRRDLFQDNKTYWLIGLAGDLGRSICDFMVSKGARHVVLTSRNPKIESRWVEEHKRNGVEVVYMRGDITSRDDLRNCHEKIKQSMPPIGGVANGALVLRDRGLVNMDLETLHQNTRPKVEGTRYLDELFLDKSLDFFIAFSSIAATVGYMGQMAYTSANMFMKALIRQRRARGIAGSVIDVSRVFGVGYLEREMKTQMAQGREQATRLLNNSGAMAISEQDLHQLFAEAVVAGRPDSTANPEIISGVETLSSVEAAKVLWAGHPRFSHFVQDVGAAKVQGVTKADTIPVKIRLETCEDAEEMKSVLIDAFVTKLKSSLMMTDESVNETTPLIDLGVDSLVAVDIRTWFAQEIGADVAVLKILGGPSIEELVDDVVSKLGPPTPAGEGQSEGDSVPSSESDKDTSSLTFLATGASSVSEVSAAEESLGSK